MGDEGTGGPPTLGYAAPPPRDGQAQSAASAVAGPYFLGILCAGGLVSVTLLLVYAVLERGAVIDVVELLVIATWINGLVALVGTCLLAWTLSAWQFLSGWRLRVRGRRWIFWSGVLYLPVTAGIGVPLSRWLHRYDFPIVAVAMTVAVYPLLAPLWLAARDTNTDE